MPRVFISNKAVQHSGGKIIDAAFNIDNFTVADTTGNTVYVIDVHCTFKGADKMQQQGGVIIYRYLLHQFKDCQEKLKVVFYSPISREHLAALHPENYVLTLLPFVQCAYDGNFEDSLQKEIDRNAFVQFNNASENLLSGWALYKCQLEKDQSIKKRMNEKDFVETVYRKDVEISKRQLVFIDDQIEEWKKTYNTIIEKEKKPSFLFYNKLITTVSGFDDKISNFQSKVKQADVIISDFYLEEHHQPNNWMGEDQLEKISGFQLLEKIKGKHSEKGINKAACYVLHSSSNKIPYYRILDANGIDNWLVKDMRTATSNEEKIENFITFKNAIEEYTANDNYGLYKALKNLWGRIEKFDENTKWWQKDPQWNKDEIIHILKSSWFSLRNFANKQTLFMEKSGVVDVNYTPASIISSLGKLCESFGINKLQKDGNCFQKYLVQTRNAGSHYSDLDQIEIYDCLIYFYCWVNALNSDSYDDAFKINQTWGSPFMIQDTGGKEKTTYKYRLLYIYMQFFNSRYSHIHSNARKLIRKRVDTLLANADKTKLLEEVLKHTPKDTHGNETKGGVKLKDVIADGIEQATDQCNFFIKDNDNKIYISHT